MLKTLYKLQCRHCIKNRPVVHCTCSAIKKRLQCG